jgi:hypothetical protein
MIGATVHPIDKAFHHTLLPKRPVWITLAMSHGWSAPQRTVFWLNKLRLIGCDRELRLPVCFLQDEEKTHAHVQAVDGDPVLLHDG